jgi:hypothetical protein
MADAATEYQKLLKTLTKNTGVEASQMFGKACLKIDGKAFMAQHLNTVVFKLEGADHAKALALPGAKLWDPSGKGRAMKEWVAVPADASKSFSTLAKAALSYVSAGS